MMSFKLLLAMWTHYMPPCNAVGLNALVYLGDVSLVGTRQGRHLVAGNDWCLVAKEDVEQNK